MCGPWRGRRSMPPKGSAWRFGAAVLRHRTRPKCIFPPRPSPDGPHFGASGGDWRAEPQGYGPACSRRIGTSVWFKSPLTRFSLLRNGPPHGFSPARGRIFGPIPLVSPSPGVLRIFYEKYAFKDRIGRLAQARVDNLEARELPEAPLEADFHLSYPFLVQEGETVFALPESRQSGRLNLYEVDTRTGPVPFAQVSPGGGGFRRHDFSVQRSVVALCP